MKLAAFAVAVLALGGSAAAAPPQTPHDLASPSTSSLTIPLTRRSSRAPVDKRGVVDQHQLAHEISRLSNKYNANFAAYEASTGERHHLDGRPAVNRRKSHKKPPAPVTGPGNSSIALNDQASQELWTGELTIGTPPQPIQVDFDTGSADLIVNAAAYDPSKSTTSASAQSNFTIAYGDGTNATGGVYTDKLQIGALTANQAFIGRSATNFLADQTNRQALAGLAFPKVANFKKGTPLFNTLMNEHLLTAPVFQMQLRQNGSSLTFGAAAPNPVWVPVTKPAWWSVRFVVNGHQTYGLLDSGTTLILAPVKDAQKLFKGLRLSTQTNSDGSVQALYDCKAPPSISLALGRFNLVLSSDSVGYGKNDKGECILSIVGSPSTGSTGWILGCPLFEQVTVSFDMGAKRVGFS